jgi:hypothetical protein
MKKYENFQHLFEFLKLLDLSPKNIVLLRLSRNDKNTEVRKATNVVIQNVKFVFNTCDKVMSMDYASWAITHGNIVQD